MTIFGNHSLSYPCCYRVHHASLFLCAPSSFLTSFRVPFIPSTSLPISEPHIAFYILLCSLMYKSLYILPQITTQCSPFRLPTTAQLLKSLPHHRQPLFQWSHRTFVFTIAIIILRSSSSIATIIVSLKTIVAPIVIIDHLCDSLLHPSLSPATFIDGRMPLVFHRYEDLLSPLTLNYLDTLAHYSEHVVVRPDENYFRTTYYCTYTDELRADLVSRFKFDPLGQSIRTFQLKFYYDTVL